jgi:RNA polymerase sigma-70 factor (ECF subfamily)
MEHQGAVRVERTLALDEDGSDLERRLEVPPDSVVALVERIRAGEPSAEQELVRRFHRGVCAVLRNVARDPTVVDDLYQETMRVLLERLRAGALREAAQLPGFVASVARNLATEHFRRTGRSEPGAAPELEGLADPAPSPAELLLRSEQARLVRQVLDELPVERDRQVLRRFYLGQESKELICADHGLTSLQFNRVLHRARERFRELWNARDNSNGRDT